MKKKRTRREKFLAEMERIVPWARLTTVIEPLYPTSGRAGPQPIGVPRILRMHCLQRWYGLAGEATFPADDRVRDVIVTLHRIDSGRGAH
jgi:IS5 family transposase